MRKSIILIALSVFVGAYAFAGYQKEANQRVEAVKETTKKEATETTDIAEKAGDATEEALEDVASGAEEVLEGTTETASKTVNEVTEAVEEVIESETK